MCSRAGSCMPCCRLLFIADTGTALSCNTCTGGSGRHDHDKQLCIQPGYTYREGRDNGDMDQRRQRPAYGRVRRQCSRPVHLPVTRDRIIVPVHLHAGRNIFVSLLDPSLDERHGCRGTLTVPSLFSGTGSGMVLPEPGGSAPARAAGAGHSVPVKRERFLVTHTFCAGTTPPAVFSSMARGRSIPSASFKTSSTFSTSVKASSPRTSSGTS